VPIRPSFSFNFFKERSFWFFYFLPLAVSLGLIVFYLYPRWQDLRLHQELLEQKKQALLKYQKRVKQLKKDLTQENFKPQEETQKVFSGKDPYLIVADLQKRFENIPEVSLRSFRVLNRKKLAESLELVRLTFIIHTDVKGLAEILSLLEKEKRSLKISRLAVNYVKNRKEEVLYVNLELEALFRTTS